VRVQLAAAKATVLAIAILALAPRPAAADGEIKFRGAYYKEKATRVQQPMLDATLDAGEHGQLDAHFLIDVITSASAAAGREGAEFTETRYENGAQYTHQLTDLRLGGGYRVSTEPDYDSVFANLRAQLELAQKNTIIGAGIAQGFDAFDDGNRGGGLREAREGDLRTTVGSLSISQVLSPVVVAGLNYDASYLDGDQENFYRQVIADGTATDEQVPDTRLRHAVSGSVRGFVVPTRSTVILGYRYYRDDWGVRSHTPELRVVQQIAGNITARLRYRYYRQSAASFYKETYDQVEELMTDDPKLDEFTGQTLGLRLASPLSRLGLGGKPGRVRAEALFEYIEQNNRFGDAVVAQIAFTVPVDY
jgi:hypothetical protein